jgi:hypothetical protein
VIFAGAYPNDGTRSQKGGPPRGGVGEEVWMLVLERRADPVNRRAN